MAAKQKQSKSNFTIILMILLLCIIVPVSFYMVDQLLFKSNDIERTAGFFSPPQELDVVFNNQSHHTAVRFSQTRFLSGDPNKYIFVYKDASRNEYFFDPAVNRFVGVRYYRREDQTTRTTLPNLELQGRGERFITETLRMEDLEFDRIHSAEDNPEITMSWSRRFSGSRTCESVILTISPSGDVMSFIIRNEGFVEEHISDLPHISFDNTDIALAQNADTILTLDPIYETIEGVLPAAEIHITEYIYETYNVTVTNLEMKYNIFEIGNTLNAYRKMIFQAEFPMDVSVDALPSVFSIKINAATDEYTVVPGITLFD